MSSPPHRRLRNHAHIVRAQWTCSPPHRRLRKRKFFYARRQPEIGVGGGGNEIVEYANVPQIIGALISNQMATLNELGTVYGVEDAYDMLEILAVDNHNRASMAKE